MQRRLEIDAARGLMLVWMTLVHLPTSLTPWVNQPFGFFSASEGFIFLSALFTGRIYFRLLERDGPWVMQRRLGMRTLRLYGYHVVLLMFLFLVAARIAVSGRTPALYNLLHYYFSAGQSHAIISSLLLVYRPPLLDIIPLYVTFLFLSPFIVLLAARTRFGWRGVLPVSFALWLLAQVGLRQALYNLLAHHTALRIPLNEMGAFNLWGWQLMWVAGMWCGARWGSGTLFAERWAERLWRPAAVVALLLLAARYAQVAGVDFGNAAAALTDKWRFAPIRLLDFASVALLAIRFHAQLRPLTVRPLVLMGQSSLHVFCTHFIFCFVGLAMIGSADHITGWPQYALIGVTFASLLAVAKIFARSELTVPRTASPGASTRGSTVMAPAIAPAGHQRRPGRASNSYST